MHYKEHLSKDKKLAPILLSKEFILTKRKNIAIQLMASIISQQLSTRVADVIFKRFLELYNNKYPSCEDVLYTSFQTLKSIGLSNNKTQYIHNVANFFIENKITDAQLHKMEDEEIVELLTQIKGIGKWTTQMILMFSLGRENVFSVDDLGIQQSMTKLYKINTANKKELVQKMTLISNKWAPYKTFACLHLWHWKDN